MALQDVLVVPQLSRPSSWPVRRERQRIAQANVNTTIVQMLRVLQQDADGLTTRLGSLGLHDSSDGALVDTISERISKSMDPRMESLENQLSHISETMRMQVENDVSLGHRIDRLETITVCQPSVDQVLSGLLAVAKDAQPEQELVLVKAMKLFTETFLTPGDNKASKAMFFDISEGSCDAGVQVDSPSRQDADTQTDLNSERCRLLDLHGPWVALETPHANVTFKVQRAFLSGDVVPCQMTSGCRGEITQLDADGDAWARIALPGGDDLTKVCIFRQDFEKLRFLKDGAT